MESPFGTIELSGFLSLPPWLATTISATIAASATAGMLWVWGRKRSAQRKANAPHSIATLIFEDGVLIDSKGDVDAVVAGALPPNKAQAVAHLSLRFADLPRKLAALGHYGVLSLDAPDAQQRLTVLRRGGLTRVDLVGLPGEGALPTRDDGILGALAAASPQVIWVEDDQGCVVWANQSYLDLLPPQVNLGWPLPSLFPAKANTASLATHEGKPRDYHISQISRGAQTMCFALDVTAQTAAEAARKQFLNGIAQIYAGLPMGIALFDRQRRLMQFNPALTDLTDLSTSFLLQRPSLAGFFDRLRASHVLPEPRNYLDWRAKLTSLEADGVLHSSLSETWHLGDGRTFRVTAQPYPDNAMAVLFEDISPEIRVTRAFRAEIDTLHGVIGALEEAIAVFAHSGNLVVANAAYYQMWSLPPDGVAPLSLETEFDRWHKQFSASALGAATAGLRQPENDRTPHVWSRLDPSTELRLSSIGGGRIMIGFRSLEARRLLEPEMTVRHIA
ncbi:Sensor protein divL [Ketogulonicigenium robustum]|uniref:Sensor protein divL n=1 Tax=Ketogulonicigenium robustum TaxID=92947 RepID=A0A1W6P2H3_9RHOB|nr:PAS-domain containing protein [Ketogulonicigenium robustum]ARO15715.1 Sensor protein divL [Ketogulonicigenium robustum]